ncbi:hypothetical protein D3C76_1373750 [compost metagenome]
MMMAGANLTAEAVRLWRTLTTRMAGSATGVFRVQSVGVYDFLLIIKGKCHRKCLWLMFPKPSILFLNMAHSIMSRKIVVWRKRLKRQWQLLILQTPITALILPPVE